MWIKGLRIISAMNRDAFLFRMCVQKSLINASLREMNDENRRQGMLVVEKKITIMIIIVPTCNSESQHRGNHKACYCLNSLHILSRFPKKSPKVIAFVFLSTAALFCKGTTQ